jgi:hypothetical protein
MYQVLKNGSLEEYYQIDVKDSWMLRRDGKEPSNGSARLGRLHNGNMYAGHRHHR